MTRCDMLTTLGQLRRMLLLEMPLVSVQEPGEPADRRRTKRITRQWSGTEATPESDKRQVQRFFKSKKFVDDAVKLYRNLSVPVYVVPAWDYVGSREKRPMELKDAMQLQYYGLSPERAAEIEKARSSGAAVFVVLASRLDKGFLPSPWMLVHAMFDSQGWGPLGKVRYDVINVLERIRDRMGYEFLGDEFPNQLTMRSARDGVLATRDDIAAEIMVQAVLTTKGFTYVEGDDPQLNADLAEIASATKDARSMFDRYIAGRVIEIDTYTLG